MTAIATAPYEVPYAYFPATSDVPSFEGPKTNDASDQLGQEISIRLSPCAKAADELEFLLRREVISSTELQAAITQFASVVGENAFGLQLQLDDLMDLNLDSGEEALRTQLAATNINHIRGFVIYDRFFRVVRVPNLAPAAFAAQIAATCNNVLSDLPYTALALDEITAIAQAMRCLFGVFNESAPGFWDNELHERRSTIPNVLGVERNQKWAQAWEGGTTAERSHRIGTYRWIVGHHFFDLCTMGCRKYLLCADDAVEHRDADVIAASLNAASMFLRGTTAAMWYAGNFSAYTYNTDVRKQMISTDSPGGFSGTQNYDYYHRMKHAKSGLVKKLLEIFGLTSDAWDDELDPSHRVKQAFLNFFETDIEDNEQHILIAAVKVGREPSIKQIESHVAARQRDGVRDSGALETTAMDMLRDMVEEKREKLDAFLNP